MSVWPSISSTSSKSPVKTSHLERWTCTIKTCCMILNSGRSLQGSKNGWRSKLVIVQHHGIESLKSGSQLLVSEWLVQAHNQVKYCFWRWLYHSNCLHYGPFPCLKSTETESLTLATWLGVCLTVGLTWQDIPLHPLLVRD
jgi:hypothetical protein